MDKVVSRNLLTEHKSRILLLSFGLLICTFTLIGCNTFDARKVSGVIQHEKVTTTHNMLGDVYFLSMDGEKRSLNEVRQPITIIAFVSADNHSGVLLNPKLIELAHYFQNQCVSVIQISVPETGSSMTTELTEKALDPYLILLIDEDQVVWDTYYQSDAGTVLLIDEEGMIVAKGTLADLYKISKKATQMIDEYYQGC